MYQNGDRSDPDVLSDRAERLSSAALVALLRHRVRGPVYGDTVRRGMYATDASHYQMMPIAVVVPLDEADVRAVVAIASEYGVPIRCVLLHTSSSLSTDSLFLLEKQGSFRFCREVGGLGGWSAAVNH